MGDNTRYAQTIKNWALPKPASFAKKQAGYINRKKKQQKLASNKIK